MKLIESYALNSGMKIKKPFIYNTYYPLPADKYIVFHFSAKDNLRNWPYWPLVIEELKKYCGEYKFVQIGVKDDPTFPGIDIDLRDKCNIKQSAYIVKNCSLFVGVDSFPIHLAGYYKVPHVGLYANSFSSCVAPVWCDKSKQRIIDVPRLDGEYPSFSFGENPQTNLRIMPEMILNAALELLDIKPLDKIETIYVGDKFNSFILECIPNQVVPRSFNPETIPYIRYDLTGPEGENHVYNQIYERKSVIVTDKALNVDLLKKLKNNLHQLIIDIKDNSLKDFVKQVHFSGINYTLITYLDDEQLNPYKLDFVDYNLILKVAKKKKSDYIKDDIYLKREWSKLTDFSNIIFRTGKFVLSNGKIYLGMANYKMERPLDNQVIWYKYEDFFNEEANNLFWQDGDFMVMQKREKVVDAE